MCRIDYADDKGGFWREELHEARTRKEHRCSDCSRLIEKGETVTRGTWLMPGEGFTSVVMCGQCVAAGRWLKKVCGGHFWPGVIEELEEHSDEEPDLCSPALRLLIDLGKRHWNFRGHLVPVERVRTLTGRAIDSVPEAALRG